MINVGHPNGAPQIPPLRYPGFPVDIGGAGELHAAYLTESRTRGRFQCSVAGNPGSRRGGICGAPFGCPTFIV
jgi:hypothetical protein